MHRGSGRALPRLLAPCLLAAGLGLGGTGHAQSSCSSDGQPRPLALMERFINADCRSCWSDGATPQARRGEVALDWVLPGVQGEDAPLSPVASRDALQRLSALGLAPPPKRATRRTPLRGPAGRLRVAHGLAVGAYVGASMELQVLDDRAAPRPWTAWLALVEYLPAGTEGSPVPRNLVRNLLQPNWNGNNQLSKEKQGRFFESRVMDIPPGTQTARLQVIGWVQDARGRVVAAAQTRCLRP